MTDGHREELKRVCIQILNDEPKDLDQLIEAAEKLYEKLLLAQYLEGRKARQANLHERITDAAREVIEQAERKEIDLPDLEAEEPSQQDETPFSMNSEIKVVPIPEGPPKPRKMEVEEPKAPEPKAEPKPIPEDAVVGYREPQSKSSINDRFNLSRLNIGLNDRIAFVKHLFGGSQEDFNRVVSQINTMDNYPEAETFVQGLVRADYNWDGKEEYEERFVGLIKARFGISD